MAVREVAFAGGAFEGETVSADAEEGEAVLEQDGQGGEGAGDHQIVAFAMLGVAPEGFGAVGDHFDVGKPEGGGGFAEEGGAALVGFDEGVGGVGADDGEGEAGEAGAGAYIGDALAGLDVANQERGEGIEEVLDCDLNGVGDGGEAAGAVLEEEGVVVGEEGELLVVDADAEVGRAGGERLVELGNGRGRDAGPTGATRWMHRRWVRRRQEPTCEPQRHEGNEERLIIRR